MKPRFDTMLMLAAALLIVACAVPDDPRHFDFERMRTQPRVETWGADRTAPNGAAMRTPPAHTVPYEGRVARDTAGDANALARGKAQFAVSCAPCHGAAGFGGGRVAMTLIPSPPPALRTGRVAAMTLEQIDDIVTLGRGRMPSYAWQIRERDRLAVAAWVAHLVRDSARDSLARDDSVEANRIAAAMAQWRARHPADSIR